jgi:hypothetical protein
VSLSPHLILPDIEKKRKPLKLINKSFECNYNKINIPYIQKPLFSGLIKSRAYRD